VPELSGKRGGSCQKRRGKHGSRNMNDESAHGRENAQRGGKKRIGRRKKKRDDWRQNHKLAGSFARKENSSGIHTARGELSKKRLASKRQHRANN